ncbi:high mobility group B protein 1-like [Eurytemora carolleeae]|uniref:high mobility group B protein 1-like n=1 Tax=Eurytemora carolleeae TaxID=1294199 RepID=UPI000C766A6F|nr:high mobility group B protein 1-like [Eurytemora carolleeae]|eukprot:XP_023339105.1 high mobility group B protein 1-like [Eurytemora affinis]
MDFLYKERGAGKRTVKPSKDSEHLEAILGEESDDSDFEVEKHKATDESGADSEASDGSAASDRSDQEEDTDDEDEEEDDLLESPDMILLKLPA